MALDKWEGDIKYLGNFVGRGEGGGKRESKDINERVDRLFAPSLSFFLFHGSPVFSSFLELRRKKFKNIIQEIPLLCQDLVCVKKCTGGWAGG